MNLAHAPRMNNRFALRVYFARARASEGGPVLFPPNRRLGPHGGPRNARPPIPDRGRGHRTIHLMPELPDLAIVADALYAGMTGRALTAVEAPGPLTVRGKKEPMTALRMWDTI